MLVWLNYQLLPYLGPAWNSDVDIVMVEGNECCMKVRVSSDIYNIYCTRYT